VDIKYRSVSQFREFILPVQEESPNFQKGLGQ